MPLGRCLGRCVRADVQVGASGHTSEQVFRADVQAYEALDRVILKAPHNPFSSLDPVILEATHNPLMEAPVNVTPTSSASPTRASSTTFHGLCYMVGDNIDTDQIIPAEYLTLVPSKPDECKKLGSYTLFRLPSSYSISFMEGEQYKSMYSIVIVGVNFN
ncbi:hypothetical protein Dimus_010185 [Dionaea muscipula]